MNAELMNQRIMQFAGRLATWCGDAQDALATLRTCLSPLNRSMWPDVAWSFSGLTRDGSPVEFGFSTHSGELRYTAEVAGPEIDHGLRLGIACELLTAMGHPAVPLQIVEDWRRLQLSGHLRWGAWLGIRNAQAPDCRETVKLYVEIPHTSQMRCELSAAIPGALLVMIGYEPGSGRTEYYFRKPRMNPSDFMSLMEMLSREMRDAMLTAFIGLTDMPLATALRWLSPAYSVAETVSGASGGLAVFVRACNVGERWRVRQKLLASMNQPNVTPYEAMFGRLSPEQLPDHGAITLTASRSGEVELRAGISGVAGACAIGD